MTKEGWDWAGKGFHYFVEGRSLCRNWGFPNYEDMQPDTGNTEPQRDDCKACMKKLIIRRKKLGVEKIVAVEPTSRPHAAARGGTGKGSSVGSNPTTARTKLRELFAKRDYGNTEYENEFRPIIIQWLKEADLEGLHIEDLFEELGYI